MIVQSLVILGILLCAGPGFAATLALEPGFTLVSGDRHYVIEGVVPPTRSLPERQAAEGWLKARLAGHDWACRSYGKSDRYGRVSFTAKDEHGDDLASAMLRAGEALADGGLFDQARFTVLLSAENEARFAGRGLWRDPPIYPIAQAAAALGQYAVLRGMPVALSEHRGGLYLDFGVDWHTAPSAFIPAIAAKHFDRQALDALVGREVELRGWIEAKSGEAAGPVRLVLFQPGALRELP